MKRTIIFIFISFFIIDLYAQSNALNYFTELYNNATSVSNQLEILRDVQKENIPGSVEFFVKVLRNINLNQSNLQTNTDRNATDETVRLIISILVEASYHDAGADIWQSAKLFSNPLVKADALIALGKIGAVNYANDVAQILKDINNIVPSDRETQIANERIAYGAILCLESFKDGAGYLPVFFASAGWYSTRVKNQASISLTRITDDPTEALIEVIRDAGNAVNVKHVALRTEERSSVSGESKSRAAVAALSEGWLYTTSAPQDRIELAGMRKLALNMLRRYGTADASVYPNINLSFTRNYDIDEKLAAVNALAALKSEEAVSLLISYLKEIHTKRLRNNWSNTDEQTIRALISALGSTRNRKAQPVLVEIANTSVYTGAINNLAAAALKDVGGR
jgi:HEAT repeat protein